ncbi:MAG: sigma 54-interacting transcriptional regulator [Gammaproteobacteria bacterium]
MADLDALKLLRALDEGVAARTGASFFPHMVSALAQTLGASCAFASEFDHESYAAQVLAFWCDGSFGENFVYPLAGSPCECVLDNEIVAFPRNVQEMFPAEKDALAAIGAQSYLAIPLCTESGKVCGHLAVIDRKERDWNEVDFEILKIFSTRAGAELERRDYEKRLESMNTALQKANGQLRREVTQRREVEERLASKTQRSEQVTELIQVITSGVTAKTGNEFFRELVRSLCMALDAHTVFVSEIDTGKYEAEILALWTGGQLGPVGVFNLAGTPCESIMDGHIASFPRRVAELFPAAASTLAESGIKSYLAIPITDESDQVIGHIAVQDQRERDWNDTDFGILKLFSNRASAELKRRGHERILENTNSQLQKSNAALRREVAKRLEMEDQLARAKRMAEEAQKVAEDASHAKSNFLAHMSHELRTPLNGILGYAQLLKRDGALNAAQSEHIGIVERSGEHLLTLINDLLDLAKIEAGRLDLHASLFDLPQLVKHAADIASVRAGQSGLEFICRVDENLPSQVHGDERAIRQVLFNLLGNAVKFTPSGRVEFRVSLASSSPHGYRVRFDIQDTGPGIAQDDLHRIFEPFDRGTANESVEGTGLGLSITRRLVNAMGGTLQVASECGVGSTFSIELDLGSAKIESAANARDAADTQAIYALTVDSRVAHGAVRSGYEGGRHGAAGARRNGGPARCTGRIALRRGAPARPPVRHERRSPAAAESERGRTMTDTESSQSILVVDDTPANIGFLLETLSKSGYRVRVATDGESALEQALYSPPCLVLLDVMMPGIDGFETCRRLRKTPKLAHVPVIFMTALSDAHDKVRAFEAGANDYITKPFQYEEVLARVQTHLSRQDLQKKLQQANSELEARVTARTAELTAALAEVERLKIRLQQENRYLKQEISEQSNSGEIIGTSPALQSALRKVALVAGTDSTVLIHGETGTGKELIARALHEQSPRRDRPLVKLNCSAISAGLVESELFGHIKGAFTGASERRIGRFELADGGTPVSR